MQFVIGQPLEASLAARRCADTACQTSPRARAEIVSAGAAEIAGGSRAWLAALGLVQDLIQRLFAVDYHPDYVGTLLHRLGWSSQKPEQLARERHKAEIERWPQLKKEHPAAS
jgi:transposase